MVDADLAELVDDQRDPATGLVAQDAVEERGLAGAEEAGEHRGRAARISHLLSSP
jgi:hypothetical protein